MKQTLFEAEAVLSANTAGMLADIDAAVAAAKAKLNSLGGSVNIGGGPGGGGGGSGGSSSNLWNHYYKLDMIQVATARSAGDYTAALAKLNAMSKNVMYSQVQLAQVTKTTTDTLKQSEGALQARHNRANKFDAAQERQAAQAIKQQTNETKQLVNAEVRAAMSMGEFNRAVQIQSAYLATTTKGTTEFYNALSKLNTLKNIGAQAGDPAARQRNAMVQNLSFGLQDFAVVMSMGGGMGRAMAAASNNLSFMMSMMGTTAGAVGGLAVTLGAVFAPALFRAATGIKDVGDYAEGTAKRLEQLQQAVDDVSKAHDRLARIRQSQKGTSKNIQEDFDEAAFNKKKAEDEYKAIMAGLPEIRRRATQDALKSLGIFGDETLQGNDAQSRFVRDMQGVQAGTTSAAELRAAAEEVSWGEDLGVDLSGKYKMVADAMEKAGESSTKAAAAIQDLKLEMDGLVKAKIAKILEEELKAAHAAEEAWKLSPEKNPQDLTHAPFDDTDFADFAKDQKKKDDDKFREQQRFLQNKTSAGESLFSSLFPKEAEIAKIKQQYKDFFGVGELPAEAQAAMDMQIAGVKDSDRKSIVGTMGGSEFASQLTNQLLQRDPMTKLTEFASKQTGLQERMAKGIEESKTALENLKPTAFSNN